MQREESKLQSSCLFNEQHISCTFKKVGASGGGQGILCSCIMKDYNIILRYNILVI